MKAFLLLLAFSIVAPAQNTPRVLAKGHPFVNQAGYNRGERKRFVCPGAPDGTPFRVLWSEDGSEPRKVGVRETGVDTGLFAANVPTGPGVSEVEASYGYLATRKSARLQVKR